MTPKQMQNLVEEIVNEDNGCESAQAHAERNGFTVIGLTDKIERHLDGKRIRPPVRKVLRDRVRRAALSLAKRSLVEVKRTGVVITFHPSKLNDEDPS